METSPNEMFPAMYPPIGPKSTPFQSQNPSFPGQQRVYPSNNFVEQQSVTNGENHQQFQSQQNSVPQPYMGQMTQQLPPRPMSTAFPGQQIQNTQPTQMMQQPLRPPTGQATQFQNQQFTGQRYPPQMSQVTSGQQLPPPTQTQNYGQYSTQPTQNYNQQFPRQPQQNFGPQTTPPVQNMGQQLPPQSQPPYGAPPQGVPNTMYQRYPGEQPPPPQPQQMQQQYYGSQGVGAPPQGYPSHAPQLQQQQQRLDPDAMPSVVQVIEDDKAKFDCDGNLMYTTTVPASVPPMVTTLAASENVSVDDHGCARPNHLRSTIWQVPVTEDLLKMTCIPLSVIVKPFDENEVDGNMMIPVTQSEIVRCNRCKAYMNPFMRFIDGGRRFQCCLCHHITEVPSSYAGHLDHTGQRLDKFERPELYLGSYEFKATAEFCRNSILNCRRPHIVFAFELTVNSKPVIQYISKHLSDIIRNYMPTDPANPGSPPPLVGFMTYDSKIQMYDIANNGHAYIICDITSTFPPFTSFLVDPLEYADQIESFLSSLPSLVPDDELETETILGPVIEAALKTCQVDNSNWFTDPIGGDSVQKDPTQVIPAGKVYLFHCTLPTYGQDNVTPGRLKPRWTTSAGSYSHLRTELSISCLDDARSLLKSDKEKQVLTPEPSKYYSELAQRCVSDYGSGVELFLFPPAIGSYLDIATISELVRLTGTGGIYTYYASSNWDVSDRFINDLKTSVKSSFAFDAIMKVRTSTGIRPVEYAGNFYARTTSDIECAALNAGNSIVVDLSYDDKLP
ncbi:transport Sec24C-like protein, partial [Leptotrombidium deliense]